MRIKQNSGCENNKSCKGWFIYSYIHLLMFFNNWYISKHYARQQKFKHERDILRPSRSFQSKWGYVWGNRKLSFSVINAVLKLCVECFESPEKHLIQMEELGHASLRYWHLIWILKDEDISLGNQGSKGILDRGNCLSQVLEVCMREHGR